MTSEELDPESEPQGEQDDAPSEGIVIYLGTTGTGKTFKALADLKALHASTGDRGALIVDSAATPTVREVRPVATLEEAIQAVWGRGEFVRWIPSDENGQDSVEDFTRLMRAIRSGGNVRVLIDEISFWVRNPEMLKLCRVWRASNATLLFTGQTVGQDFGQGVLGCNPTFHVYKLTAPRSIEFVEKWLQVDPAEIRALELGEHITLRM